MWQFFMLKLVIHEECQYAIVSQTGFCETLGVRKGVLGVPRDENELWRTSFTGGRKFVCTN